MSTSTRLIGLTGIVGLVAAGVVLGPTMRAPDVPSARHESAAGSVVFEHHAMAELTEVGYRTGRELRLNGRIESGRDATGPTFVLVEPDGQRIRIAYANGGDPALREALERCRGSGVYTLSGTVLDWGRGIRSFNMGKALTITR